MKKRTLLKAACGVYRVKRAEEYSAGPLSGNTWNTTGDLYPSKNVAQVNEKWPGWVSAAAEDTPANSNIKAKQPTVRTGSPKFPDEWSYKPSTLYDGIASDVKPPNSWGRNVRKVFTPKRLLQQVPGAWNIIDANQTQKDMRNAYGRGDYFGSDGALVNGAYLTNAGMDLAAAGAQALGYNSAAASLAGASWPMLAAIAAYQVGASNMEAYEKETKDILDGRGEQSRLKTIEANNRCADPRAGTTPEEQATYNLKLLNKEKEYFKNNPDADPGTWRMLTNNVSGGFGHLVENVGHIGNYICDKSALPYGRNIAALDNKIRYDRMGLEAKGPWGWNKFTRLSGMAPPEFREYEYHNPKPFQSMVDFGQSMHKNRANELDSTVSQYTSPSLISNKENRFGTMGNPRWMNLQATSPSKLNDNMPEFPIVRQQRMLEEDPAKAWEDWMSELKARQLPMAKQAPRDPNEVYADWSAQIAAAQQAGSSQRGQAQKLRLSKEEIKRAIDAFKAAKETGN